MKRKSVLCIVLSVVCMFGLSSCQESTQTDNEQSQDTEDAFLIGYSVIDMKNPYFVALQSAVQETLDENEGFEMITEDPSTDYETQNKQIHEMIKQGIDAIILSPVDSNMIRSALVELQQAGVKIVNVDNKVKETGYVNSYIGSDNYLAGYMCGENLIRKCPDGAKVAILESTAMNSINDRISGFEDALAESEKPFKVVTRANTEGKLKTALKEAESILKIHPDIDAIMCGDDQMAVGAKTAANLANNDVYIYSVDGSPDIKKELKKTDSQILGTVGQSPVTIGHDAAETAIRILSGQEYEKEICEDVFMINAENVDEFGIDTWQ